MSSFLYTLLGSSAVSLDAQSWFDFMGLTTDKAHDLEDRRGGVWRTAPGAAGREGSRTALVAGEQGWGPAQGGAGGVQS